MKHNRKILVLGLLLPLITLFVSCEKDERLNEPESEEIHRTQNSILELKYGVVSVSRFRAEDPKLQNELGRAAQALKHQPEETYAVHMIVNKDGSFQREITLDPENLREYKSDFPKDFIGKSFSSSLDIKRIVTKDETNIYFNSQGEEIMSVPSENYSDFEQIGQLSELLGNKLSDEQFENLLKAFEESGVFVPMDNTEEGNTQIFRNRIEGGGTCDILVDKDLKMSLGTTFRDAQGLLKSSSRIYMEQNAVAGNAKPRLVVHKYAVGKVDDVRMIYEKISSIKDYSETVFKYKG